MAKISQEQALLLLNVGGWQLRSGRMTKGVTPNVVVTGAEIVADVLMLRNGTEAVASINIERLSVDVTDEDRPRRLAFNGPFMVKQQRKKIDGGGWHEVEQIGTQLLLVNAAAQAQHETEVAEKQRLVEQEKKDAQRQADEQAAAAWTRHLAEYVARQKDRLRGAQFEDLCVHGDSVTVKFSGGIELTVELHDREDPCDVHSEASIGIVIGGEHLQATSRTA